jgi:acyl carrier protein
VADLLKVKRIDPAASLLECGATSLDIFRISNLLESQLHVRLELSQLFRLSTITAIATYCEQHLDETFTDTLRPVKKDADLQEVDFSTLPNESDWEEGVI